MAGPSKWWSSTSIASNSASTCSRVARRASLLSARMSSSGALAGTNQGSDDVFLARLDQSGALDQTQFGTVLTDNGRGVSIDAAGNRYVVWISSNTPSPPEPRQLTSMVTKYDAAGTSVWTTKVVGDPGGETNLFGIVADAAGNSYAVGYTSGSPSGPTDLFVTKLDPLGKEVWKTRYTGSPTTDFG